MKSPEHTDTDRRTTPRERLCLAGIVALALALRLAYLFGIRDHALFSIPTGDPAVYQARAVGILSGVPVPSYPFFHSCPFYPFFLALISRLGGAGPHAVRIVQSGAGCVSVLLIYVLAKLTVGRKAALIAALLAALYVPFIFFEGEILEITLVVTFLAGALILLLGAERTGSAGRAAGAGALLGLASLGKPNLLLFAPVGALWLLLARRPSRLRAALRSRAPAAAAFLVVALAVISPATIHNYRASGDLIPVSSNGGINLYIGNHPGAPGVFQVPPEMRFDLRVASKEAAERALRRPLTAGEVSDYWAGRAFAFMRARPGQCLAQTGRKLALFWNHYEIPNHYDLHFVSLFAPILRIPIGTFGVVAPLGVLGTALAWKRRRNVGLLIAFGVTFLISVLPFFITGRYRLAIALVLLPGAGFAVSALVDMLRARSFRWLGGTLAALAALAVAVNVNVIDFGFAQMHNTLGTILGERADMEGAIREFRMALGENPRDLSARYNMGVALLELRRHEDAADAFRLAVTAHPRYYEAWIGLGRACAALGLREEALEAWRRVLTLSPPPPPGIAAEAAALTRSLTTTEEEPNR